MSDSYDSDFCVQETSTEDDSGDEYLDEIEEIESPLKRLRRFNKIRTNRTTPGSPPHDGACTGWIHRLNSTQKHECNRRQRRGSFFHKKQSQRCTRRVQFRSVVHNRPALSVENRVQPAVYDPLYAARKEVASSSSSEVERINKKSWSQGDNRPVLPDSDGNARPTFNSDNVQPCPICGVLFAYDELQSHVNEELTQFEYRDTRSPSIAREVSTQGEEGPKADEKVQDVQFSEHAVSSRRSISSARSRRYKVNNALQDLRSRRRAGGLPAMSPVSVPRAKSRLGLRRNVGEQENIENDPDIELIQSSNALTNHCGFERETFENLEGIHDASVSLKEIPSSSEEESSLSSEDDSFSAVSKLLRTCEQHGSRIVSMLKEWQEMPKDLEKQPSGCELRVNPPSCLKKSLYGYQIAGLNWLYLLHVLGINGILADEMGLGKTAQVIALLALLKSREEPGPHLIIVPATTLHNWRREFDAWCPSLKVLLYWGSVRERMDLQYQQRNEPAEVVITTYNTVFNNQDRAFLRGSRFHYLILDEAQHIKNSTSKRFSSISSLRPRRRLLLSGTPLQNNLQELWALLHFLMPPLFELPSSQRGLLSELNDISRVSCLERVRTILSPFVLRRLKSEVLTELPKKKYHVLPCPLSSFQYDLYRNEVQNCKAMWNCKLETTEISNSNADDVQDGCEAVALSLEEEGNLEPFVCSPHIPTQAEAVSPQPQLQRRMANVLMELRKLANHPLLCRSKFSNDVVRKLSSEVVRLEECAFFNEPQDEVEQELFLWSDFQLHCFCGDYVPLSKFCLKSDVLWKSAGKMTVLGDLLKRLRKEHQRPLIFSQMTRMLDILEVFLKEYLHFTCLRLDGSTPVGERQVLIDRFNEDRSVHVFLLSTRAGGLGVNLSGADTVVFYDLSFNPQVDRQAEDRCHRVGQTREVSIFKLVAKPSIDEHMLELCCKKLELSDGVLQEGTCADDKVDDIPNLGRIRRFIEGFPLRK